MLTAKTAPIEDAGEYYMVIKIDDDGNTTVRKYDGQGEKESNGRYYRGRKVGEGAN